VIDQYFWRMVNVLFHCRALYYGENGFDLHKPWKIDVGYCLDRPD